jgi:uncharacterized surface protein with fasciclin (FAS1) repeats
VCFDTMATLIPAEGDGFDTAIHVREGNCNDSLAEIYCNDDCAGARCLFGGENVFLSQLTVEAQAGTSYFVFVDGVFGSSGDFVLTMSPGGCDEELPADNLMATLRADPDLATFVDGLETTGLDGLLNGDEQYTVFAPTNEAFSSLGDQALNDLIADPQRLAAVLRNHIVAGRVGSRLLEGRGEFPTLGATALHADSRGGVLMVSGAAIVEQDTFASNGILHVLSGLALAPNMCMNDAGCGENQVCGAGGLCEIELALGTCGNPFLIDAFDWYDGDTEDRVSNEFASCVGVDDAPDHVYSLRAEGPFEPFPGLPLPVCLTTLGTMFDTVLHVREGDCEGQEVACNNETVLQGNGGFDVYDQAQLTLMVETDQAYRIIVDGDNGEAGPYTLGVINGACDE